MSDVLILAGVLLLFTVTLFWVRSALAAHQAADQPYLVSKVELAPPLPTLTRTLTPPLPTLAPVDELASAASETNLPEASTPQEAAEETASSQPTEEIPPTQPAEEIPPPEALLSPTPAMSPGPVIRLVIPRLQVNRAVVPVELRREASGTLEWNTDALFSTPNRPDLVGQLAVSSNPGDGGNIILVGHNYNEGWYGWEGVFVALQTLHPGDEIFLYTENGGEFGYVVQKVKKVPWQARNTSELEKHQKYLWPSDHEQLTLVSCGGVNLLTWQARIYVVAVPLSSISP